MGLRWSGTCRSGLAAATRQMGADTVRQQQRTPSDRGLVAAPAFRLMSSRGHGAFGQGGEAWTWRSTTTRSTFELFKNALFAIADEMALTVFRTTYSGVIKDNMDYSTAFCDADGSWWRRA